MEGMISGEWMSEGKAESGGRGASGQQGEGIVHVCMKACDCGSLFHGTAEKQM